MKIIFSKIKSFLIFREFLSKVPYGPDWHFSVIAFKAVGRFENPVGGEGGGGQVVIQGCFKDEILLLFLPKN